MHLLQSFNPDSICW